MSPDETPPRVAVSSLFGGTLGGSGIDPDRCVGSLPPVSIRVGRVLPHTVFSYRPVGLLVRSSVFQAVEVGFESHTGHFRLRFHTVTCP